MCHCLNITCSQSPEFLLCQNSFIANLLFLPLFKSLFITKSSLKYNGILVHAIYFMEDCEMRKKYVEHQKGHKKPFVSFKLGANKVVM